MDERLKRLLDHLAASLDPRRQAEIDLLHRKTLDWEPVARLPLVLTYPIPSDAIFQPYPHREVFDDPEKMLYNELLHGFDASMAYRDQLDDDLALTIRANFGTVVIASMFGAKIEQVEDNPPWVRHFETIEEFQAALDRDPLDFSQGWCPRVVDRYRFYRDTLATYPEIASLVRLVLPDLQGPLDTAELLRGSEIYVDLCCNPEVVQRALDSIARAQIGFAQHLLSHINDGPEGFGHQHAQPTRGRILIRDDSAIMISPAMYRRHVASYDEMVLSALGTGGIHACGKCEHLIDEIFALPSVRCVDLGQPELNDIDAIYAKAKPRKIPLVQISATREDLVTGRIMERFPTGVSLVHRCESLADARTVMAAYRNATE